MSAVSTHPSSLDLEAFACGDSLANVEKHLDACGECKAFVAKIVEASRAFAAGPIDDMLRAAERLLGTNEGRASEERAGGGRDDERVVSLESRRRALRSDWRMVALPLVAAAAGVLVWWRLGAGDGGPAKPTQPVAQLDPPSAQTSQTDPETTFKGGVQVAVVRERMGDQQRFTSQVAIRGGDRLRIEVALDRPETILAGVLADDGTWLDLMPEGTRGPGTHFSEQAARFDEIPMRGWIIVGTPEAIAQSRAAHSPRGVTAMRLGWEGR